MKMTEYPKIDEVKDEDILLVTSDNTTKTTKLSTVWTWLKNQLKNADLFLPLTGGTITGVFKVFAKGTNQDPRLHVQENRIDMLKTDGGTSVIKITPEEMDMLRTGEGETDHPLVRINKDQLSIRSKKTRIYEALMVSVIESDDNNSSEARFLKYRPTPTNNKLSVGLNKSPNYQFSGMYADAEGNTDVIAFGQFSGLNDSLLVKGMAITNSGLKIISEGKEHIKISEEKMSLRPPNIFSIIINDNPCFEADKLRTKMRLESSEENKTKKYVIIEQGMNDYANYMHNFLDEKEQPGTVSMGHLQMVPNASDKTEPEVFVQRNIKPFGLDQEISTITIEKMDLYPVTVKISIVDKNNDLPDKPVHYCEMVICGHPKNVENQIYQFTVGNLPDIYAKIQKSPWGFIIIPISGLYTFHVSVIGNAIIHD